MVLLSRLPSFVSKPSLLTALQQHSAPCCSIPATCSGSTARKGCPPLCGTRPSVPPLQASGMSAPDAQMSGQSDASIPDGSDATESTAQPSIGFDRNKATDCKLPWLNVPVFLGSQSASRRGIMDSLAEELGFEYTAVSAGLDEKEFRASDANELVMMLAGEKANAIMRQWVDAESFPKQGLLITADQVVVCKSQLLEKPASLEQARDFIEGYSNGTCMTVGAIRVLNLENGQNAGETDICTIEFKEIPPHVIDELVKDKALLNCAGGLMIESELIQPYIAGVTGNLDSVMGMSCQITLDLMRKCCLPMNRTQPIN